MQDSDRLVRRAAIPARIRNARAAAGQATPSAADRDARRSWRARLPYLALVAAVLLFSAAVVVVVTATGMQFSDLAAWGYPGIFLLNLVASATVILPVPGIAAAPLGGTFLNPLLVGVFGGLGSALGELSGYFAGYGGSAVVENSERYKRMMHWMSHYGYFALFALSAIPNPLFDLAGIAAGALRFPVWRFCLVCAAGKIAKFTLLAYTGMFVVDRAHGWL